MGRMESLLNKPKHILSILSITSSYKPFMNDGRQYSPFDCRFFGGCSVALIVASMSHTRISDARLSNSSLGRCFPMSLTFFCNATFTGRFNGPHGVFCIVSRSEISTGSIAKHREGEGGVLRGGGLRGGGGGEPRGEDGGVAGRGGGLGFGEDEGVAGSGGGLAVGEG